MKKLVSIFTVFLFTVSLSFAQSDSDYRETLKNMFEVSGSEGAYTAAIHQMMSMYKQQYSNVSPEIWDELEKEFYKTSLDDLVDMLVPVYQKYLTQDDLKELIRFYETPVGKKFAKNTPAIMQESMQAGQKWGMKIGQDFQKKMQEKGY